MILAGCRRQPAETFGQLVEEAVYQSLAFSPVSATQAGYHRHKDKNLD